MAGATSLLPTSGVQGECRAELARALLSRRLHSQFHIAKIQKIIEKTKCFPDYFLTKKRCPETKKRKPLTSVSLFSSLGNRSMSPDLTPGACPHDYTNNSRNHQIFWQLFSLNNVQINLTLSRPFYRCGYRGPCGWACRRGDGRRGHARRRALQRPAWR